MSEPLPAARADRRARVRPLRDRLNLAARLAPHRGRRRSPEGFDRARVVRGHLGRLLRRTGWDHDLLHDDASLDFGGRRGLAQPTPLIYAAPKTAKEESAHG